MKTIYYNIKNVMLDGQSGRPHGDFRLLCASFNCGGTQAMIHIEHRKISKTVFHEASVPCP